MAIFSSLLASTALALALLAAPQSANALVTSGGEIGHLAARHAVSPVHHVAKNRKRNAHKLRRRCLPRNGIASGAPPAVPSTTENTGTNPANTGNNGNGNTNTNTGNTNTGTTTPPPSTGYAGGGKVGLAWPNGDVPEFANFVTSKVGYYYTWSPWNVNSAYTRGAKHAPMFWGEHQAYDWNRLVVRGYADVALGMNEVNQHDQSAMDIWRGRDLWNQYVGPLRYQGYRLGSPATTSAPDGLEWIKNWLPIINEKPDFLCVHWYDVGFANFKAYVEKFHNETGYNIWVTEFACQNFNGGAQCSRDEIFSFMNQATEWMDNTPWIEAYFAFGTQRDMVNVNYDNKLMNDDGTPNDLGWAYLT